MEDPLWKDPHLKTPLEDPQPKDPNGRLPTEAPHLKPPNGGGQQQVDAVVRPQGLPGKGGGPQKGEGASVGTASSKEPQWERATKDPQKKGPQWETPI